MAGRREVSAQPALRWIDPTTSNATLGTRMTGSALTINAVPRQERINSYVPATGADHLPRPIGADIRSCHCDRAQNPVNPTRTCNKLPDVYM